ncbi:translation initiation factor IF-2 subunit alpha [Candidatus Woesearchaeota archaeon]|nr:translation initiation factor IF-2 subunit alpha [Candidatus Woesearchaeota archaeon]
MLLRKTGFPEESELIMCTVTSVQHHSVFVNLDEYELQGMIHISEVSPGRIRNIRDFVKEGKVIICKVLRINRERGHIDLSLRRVTEIQRRAKVNEIKQEQLAEKILEQVAKKHRQDLPALYRKITTGLKAEYLGLYPYFEAVLHTPSLLTKLDLGKDISHDLLTLIQQRIKLPQVTIKGVFKIGSYAANGVSTVQEVLLKAEAVNPKHITLRYLGAGAYEMMIIAADYKAAETMLKKAVDASLGYLKKEGGFGEFVRAD